MSKDPELVDGVVKSVYRHSITTRKSFSFQNLSKTMIRMPAISWESIHQDLSRLVDTPKNILKAQSAYFLKEGISIEAKQ